MFWPTERQCALLLLRALQERGERRPKPMTRARVSEITLRRLWKRERLTQSWLANVNDWLLTAGWTMVDAGSTYGVVKTGVVQDWPRVASKYVEEELKKAELEKEDGIENYLDSLEELLTRDGSAAEQSPDDEDEPG